MSRRAVARLSMVTAAAGVGKSRLVHELLAELSAADRARRSGSRGATARAGSAFAMLGQVIRAAAQIRDGEPIEVRRDKSPTAWPLGAGGAPPRRDLSADRQARPSPRPRARPARGRRDPQTMVRC
ncbi:MAG: hypothetical protein U0359_21260 [Byssovorax sp.]